MNNQSLKEWALVYARLGWQVFPVTPNAKTPAIKGSFKEATLDEEQIARWWDTCPNYNIGIATSDNLFVIDFDEDEAKDKHGIRVMTEFTAINGAFPTTVMSRTPRGGQHLFFTGGNEKVRTCTGLFNGVDVRAAGGYVLAPPSVVNGKQYAWINAPVVNTVAGINESVRTFLSPPATREKRSASLPESIPEGKRTSVMVSLIGSMKAKGLSDEAIRAAVEKENATCCQPPLTDEELEKTVFPALTRDWQATSPYDRAAQPRIDAQRQQTYSTDVTCLSDVSEKEPEWLVEGYMPRYETTVMAGDGGVGKSFAWCAIAAAISSGRRCFLLNNAFNDSVEGRPQKVMFFSSEDSADYVLTRRLRENGANLSNIITIDSSDSRFADIQLDSIFLERLLENHKPALCIFDPLQSFLPKGTNMVSRSDMRNAMNKLHLYGEKYGTTFLIVMHTNKQTSVWGRTRLADSADIWDIARSVLIVGKPANSEHMRYLSHEKSNYAAQCQTVLFRLESGVVVWAGYTDKRDREFMLEASNAQRNTPVVDDACALIMDCLTTEGRCTPKQLSESAKLNGISPNALRTAKERLINQKKISEVREGNGAGKGVQIYYLPIPSVNPSS